MALVNTFETPSTTHSMNFRLILLGALTAAPLLSLGQTDYTFADQKIYRQIDDREFVFEGGSLDLGLTDGSFVLSDCLGFALDGSIFLSGSFPRLIPPNLACPLGTTGFFARGDGDDDGAVDFNFYRSISAVRRAVLVEPFQPRNISLIAAPPSDLSRPLGGSNWEDQTTVIYFDQINFPVTGYEITDYSSQRVYGPGQSELKRQLKEIVPGEYIQQFPRIDDDFNPVYIRLAHLQMIEAWPGRGRVPGPNEFTLLNDGLWNDEALEVDPDIFFRFSYRGFDGITTVPSDSTFFSMERTVDTDDGPAGQIVFPPYGANVPEIERFPELIRTPSTFYELGPNFANIGDLWTANLSFQRNLQSTGISRDTSTRNFRWNVRFVDTFAGYARRTFPTVDDEELIADDFDYDDDGFTNLEEFALQTDPTDPASVPVISPVIDGLTGQCVLTIPKRGQVGARLRYQVQYTTDLVSWTTITSGDSQWAILQDDAAAYEVVSRQPAPPATCLLRVLITQE